MPIRPALLALALTAAFAAQAAGPNVDKVNGSITAEAGQSYGSLETVNGSIRIHDGARTGDASTVNGSITLGDQAGTGDLETVNGSIRMAGRVDVDGDVQTVNGSIFADRGGRIRGGVSTVNGAIGLVASEVGGNVETVTGDITVGIDSHVAGGLRVEKPRGMNWQWKGKRDPRIVIGPNARVDGAMMFERKVTLYVHRTAKTGPITGATAIPFDGPTAPDSDGGND